jgi:hypothetical protein
VVSYKKTGILLIYHCSNEFSYGSITTARA